MSSARHLIIGTAGHIDHGKTSLVKALTGTDCDTHPEEKARGITIHLGFAHLELPDGSRLGVVDVPGHAAFVRTMIAGASGMDLALLVVAADSGIMPQTHEHLQILSVLNIRRGVIALTKADLADAEMLAMAREELAGAVAGTFLADAPVVPVSAKTGVGLAELRQAIATAAAGVTSRPAGAVFRLFVDRIFTVAGVGTVVTGSVLGGALHRDATAYLLPAGRELRVRRLERFGAETDCVTTGDRAALNLTGLDRGDFVRGMLIADRPLRSTQRLDARLQLFGHTRSLALWAQAIFHLGTYEAQARIHLLDRDGLAGGQEALVQVHLPSPCMAQVGDRFVLRSTSSDLTLGGGEVIDAFPLHHRRRPEELVVQLRKIADGHLPELVAAEIRKARRALSVRTLADVLNVPAADLAAVTEQLPADIVRFTADGTGYLHTAAGVERDRDSLLRQIRIFHKRNPLEAGGPTVGALLGATGRLGDAAASATYPQLLAQLVTRGLIKPVGNTWAAAEHQVDFTPELQRQLQGLRRYLEDCGLKTPLLSEMLELGTRLHLDEPQLRRILHYLVQRGELYVIAEDFVSATVVDRTRRQLLAALEQRPAGLTVAEFRDLIGGNRKICLLLLGHFDNEGVTRREGDRRLITDKGRKLLETAHA